MIVFLGICLRTEVTPVVCPINLDARMQQRPHWWHVGTRPVGGWPFFCLSFSLTLRCRRGQNWLRKEVGHPGTVVHPGKCSDSTVSITQTSPTYLMTLPRTVNTAQHSTAQRGSLIYFFFSTSHSQYFLRCNTAQD